MRIFFFILMFLIAKSSLSQTLKIVDSSAQLIPYVTIEIPKKNITLFADKNGAVDLKEAALIETDTLIISAIGYTTTKLLLSNGNNKVTLKRQIRVLPEVLVYNGKWKSENWGSQKKPRLLSNTYSCGWNLRGPGDQIGKVVANKNFFKNTHLTKVIFYTQNAKGNKTPVRLRIYEINDGGLPGNDVLNKTITKQIDSNDGWLEFDITEERLVMKDSLLFAAEYFDTNKNNWKTYTVTYMDKAGNKETKIAKQYGAHFATNDESDGGETWRRHNGQWGTNRYITKDHCRNLVVQVWVKYPDLNN